MAGSGCYMPPAPAQSAHVPENSDFCSNSILHAAAEHGPPADTAETAPPAPHPPTVVAPISSKRSSFANWFDTGFACLGLGKKHASLPNDQYLEEVYAVAEIPGAGDPTRQLTAAEEERHSGAAAAELPTSPSAQRSWFVLPWAEQPVTTGVVTDDASTLQRVHAFVIQEDRSGVLACALEL